jgi:hypothetical protein
VDEAFGEVLHQDKKPDDFLAAGAGTGAGASTVSLVAGTRSIALLGTVPKGVPGEPVDITLTLPDGVWAHMPGVFPPLAASPTLWS